MKRSAQFILYIIFAFLSTILNVVIQKFMEISVKYFQPAVYDAFILPSSRISYGLLIQMFTATVLAFIFKYLADKLIIFRDKTAYISKAHFRQVLIYGSFAVITTLIFWITELSFKYFLHFMNSEYIGAFLGLCIGYGLKFVLDRKYVFS